SLFQSEYHYEYTECDSTGSRWRVAVPHTPGLCTGLPDPIKGTNCSFSCKAGEFLDMKAQACQPCAQGTYSLGTSIRFDEWDEVPHGFANVAANVANDGFSSAMESCTGSMWVPLGDYVASNTDECTATLMYAVKLKQSGTVSFEYIYPDSSIVFEFFVQNDQCQPMAEQSRWMRMTEKSWEFHSVELSHGNNVLNWRTTAFSVWSKVPKPVLVRNISITGVAFTSECFPCKPGTYAPTAGSSACQPCPPNTFSSKGATTCQPCDPTTYAEPGSASCTARPPCTDQDYFYTHSPCDAPGQTQVTFRWAEPKVCSEELPEAARLPPPGGKTRCPPCNPGFAPSNGSTCQPCPHGSYSNGSGCISCPAGTEPVLGLEYKWWNVLPPNMETTVLSGTNFEYKGMAGWEVAGDYIYTAAGASNDFMILTLVVPGFSPPSPVLEDAESKEVARITFVFEMICNVSCELYFMVGINSRTNTPVETWMGPKGKQSYTYIVEENATMSFIWAFQRSPYHEAGRWYSNDMAKLYSINITNVLGGVASFCRHCVPKPAGSCTTCAPGYALDHSLGTCQPCPPGTYLRSHLSDRTPTCHPCGPGTRSNQLRSLCYNNCSFSLALKGQILHYNFSALATSMAFTSGPSFTTKGLKYFHHFNISLCGNQGRKMASCVDNVTDMGVLAGKGDFARVVTSYVCQSILVPSNAMSYKTAVSSQPVSLADHLVGVSAHSTLGGITSPIKHFPPGHVDLPDIIFFYRSNDATQPCSSGRATTIRLRCDPLRPGPGTLTMPRNCPEGTCDGCTFHFLWVTGDACPLCSASHYRPIVSACLGGVQKTTYVWQEPRLCRGGQSLPAQEVRGCRSADFWLKVGISAGTCAALLLTALATHFWKKNQKLEYKYSKLVVNATAKESELSVPDSCAIMEGEDAEDDLVMTTKRSLFGKIMSFTYKRTSDGFDSVLLKTSSGNSTMEL
ncbi:K1324 protein, partial [Crotophaga sulcirostris]|nr:K1324 protein [Crotophaga sulcirostris]